MYFNKRACDPNSKYIQITKEIANQYLSCLNNPAVFKSKLARAYISLFELPVKRIHGCTQNSQTKSNILITFNEDVASEKHIAFCIAHELAHMLVYNLSNKLSFSDKELTYTTPDGTVVQKNNQYQLDMEEAIADHLALYIVSKLDYDDSNHSLEQYLASENQMQKSKLISDTEVKYGTPLFQCEKIDEFAVMDDNITIANALWYDCVTHALQIKIS